MNSLQSNPDLSRFIIIIIVTIMFAAAFYLSDKELRIVNFQLFNNWNKIWNRISKYCFGIIITILIWWVVCQLLTLI